MDPSCLERLIESFIKNLVPEKNTNAAYREFMEILQDNLKKSGRSSMEHRLRGEMLKYYEYVSIVVELVDKGNCGFLTGDVSPRLVLAMDQKLSILIQRLNESGAEIGLNSDERNKLVSDYYSNLFKVCSDELFKLPINGIPYPDFENPRNLFERQLILEDESSEIAIGKFMANYDNLTAMGMAQNLAFSRSYIIKWFPDLCKAIKEEQQRCMEPNLIGDRANYAPYLLKLTPEKLALISLSEIMKYITKMATMKDENNGQNYYIISKLLFASIGKSINMQIQFEVDEYNIHERIQMELKTAADAKNKSFLMKKSEMLRKAASENILRGKVKNRVDVLNKTVQLQLGSLMVYFLKSTAKIKNSNGINQSLITLSYVKSDPSNPFCKNLIGVLKIHEDFIINLMRDIEKEDSLFIQLDRSLPMIYKPAPWVDYEIGGYYQRPTNVMRIQNSTMQENAVKYAEMTEVFNLLDIIGRVPWRINKKVLEVMVEIWNGGGGVGELPPKHYNFQDYIYEYQLRECKDKFERRKLEKKIQLQRDMHSLRCSFSLRLDQARAFAKVGKFYYPHNLDFRGRIYPIPPHLNHMSADMCRGLLEFGEGKPLGKTGLDWLKIHMANKMGKDKLSMQGRLDYANSMLPLVEKIAKNPCQNREWLELEDSWQALSAILDVYAAITSPNPEEYVSHQHIHQDGSCNGLQHYAALGRDFEGAFQVNLVNREIPGDLYTHIAKMVEEKISKDCEDPENQHFELAKKLKGNVKRKIIKQTVMTTVYGVTFIGAKKQIQKQLRDKDFLNQDNDLESYAASSYLAKLTLDCVANLFTQAHEIKQWLKDCSKSVCEMGYAMSWVTPLG